jgi:hypothetical protein
MDTGWATFGWFVLMVFLRSIVCLSSYSLVCLLDLSISTVLFRGFFGDPSIII